MSSIITDLCVDLKYKLFTYLNCSNLFLMPHFFYPWFQNVIMVTLVLTPTVCVT